MRDFAKGFGITVLALSIVCLILGLLPLIRYLKFKIALYHFKKDFNVQIEEVTAEYEDITRTANASEIDQEALDNLYKRLLRQEERILTIETLEIFSFDFEGSREIHLKNQELKSHFWNVFARVQKGEEDKSSLDKTSEVIESYDEAVRFFSGDVAEKVMSVTFYKI